MTRRTRELLRQGGGAEQGFGGDDADAVTGNVQPVVGPGGVSAEQVELVFGHLIDFLPAFFYDIDAVVQGRLSQAASPAAMAAASLGASSLWVMMT